MSLHKKAAAVLTSFIPSPRKEGNLVIRSNDQGESSQSQSQAGISSVINEGEGNKLGTQGSGHSGSDKDDVSLESYDTVEDKMSHYDKKSTTSSDSQPSPCGRCRSLYMSMIKPLNVKFVSSGFT